MSVGHKPCRFKTVSVTQEDLPIFCPVQDDRIWDAHPRVYLSLEKNGRVMCPYCDTEFVLNEAAGD